MGRLDRHASFHLRGISRRGFLEVLFEQRSKLFSRQRIHCAQAGLLSEVVIQLKQLDVFVLVEVEKLFISTHKCRVRTCLADHEVIDANLFRGFRVSLFGMVIRKMPDQFAIGMPVGFTENPRDVESINPRSLSSRQRIGRSTALSQASHLPEIAEQLASAPFCRQVADSLAV